MQKCMNAATNCIGETIHITTIDYRLQAPGYAPVCHTLQLEFPVCPYRCQPEWMHEWSGCVAGWSDSVALCGTQWTRPGDGPVAGARCSSHCQDQERIVTAAHECPGRPRRLRSYSALPSRGHRRRHHCMLMFSLHQCNSFEQRNVHNVCCTKVVTFCIVMGWGWAHLMCPI